MRHLILLAVALGACGTEGIERSLDPQTLFPIDEEPQRLGDPQAGFDALTSADYVGCGIPMTAYSAAFAPPAPEDILPGRPGDNGDVPYFMTKVRRPAGYDAMVANCLYCHSSQLRGELVMGLGSTTVDFTGSRAQAAELAGFLLSDPNERAEWRKWADRIVASDPYTQTETIGQNPADNLAAILFAHRDPETLAWSSTPQLAPPPNFVNPVDVPPWWRMKKKNAMFYSASGRGDQARIMMSASALCTDTRSEAEAIDAYFDDVRAYILSLEPPAWPFSIDATVADDGKAVFEANCSRCHGTYGPGGEYPNLLVALDEVGTDTALARSGGWLDGRFADWFNRSFYGETARFEPGDGYVAPPLDGIWATAPFLHNGSVPTLAALLDSSLRPVFWERTFDTSDFDEVGVGWNFTEPTGKPSSAQRRFVYDTSLQGHGKGGHTYGDDLTAGERAAVIEYLKTL